MNAPLPRRECPPGLCDCRPEALEAPGADLRILHLTAAEEKRLLARLEAIDSLAELERLQARMDTLLGIRTRIGPGHGEVRSMRGIRIEVQPLPGLCRKTRQRIPTAIRRALEKRPEIAYALLNAHDLLRDA